MNDEQAAEFDSALRMIDFNKAHPALFESNAKMKNGFIALAADVATLEAAGASRVSSSGLRRDATADKGAAKDDLYKLVRKTVETGKTIKKEEPGFDNKFKIRRGTLSGQELLDVARAFADDLTAPITAKFAEYGAASVAAANYAAKINAYEAARAQQNTGKSSGIAATAATRAAVKNLIKTCRTLAAVGANIIEETDDDALLAEWKSACKVEKRKPSAPKSPPAPVNP